MKHLTVLLTLALALAVLPAAAAPAPVEPGNVLLRSQAVSDEDLRVTLANLEHQDTEITLESMDGERVFLRQRIRKHNGYSLRIDLSSLDSGRYLLEVRQADETLQQVVLVEDEYILVSRVTTSAG